MNQYYVYAIESLKDGRIYVGLSLNVDRRIQEHNAGQTRSTKPWRPWKLIFSKMVGKRKNARALEKKLKSGYGKEFLKRLIKTIIY